MLREGSIVDVTIISASCPISNENGERDRIVGRPKMHQAKKGNRSTSKARYRGLGKNTKRLHLLAAFINLLIGEKYLLALGQCACFL